LVILLFLLRASICHSRRAARIRTNKASELSASCQSGVPITGASCGRWMLAPLFIVSPVDRALTMLAMQYAAGV
jgi:hypothetical protein